MDVPDGWEASTYAGAAFVNKRSLSPNKVEPEQVIRYMDIASVAAAGAVGEMREIAFAEAPSRARRIVHSGDTVVSTVRPYLRAVAFVQEAPPNLVASTGFAVLSPRDGVDPRFLYQTVLRAEFVDFLTGRMKGSNYPAVRPSDVSQAPILLPPLAEQKKIADILGSVDDAIQASQAVIDQTRRVKQGLFKQLLTRGIGHTRFKPTEIGEIPESWDVVSLGNLASFVTSGSRDWAQYYAQDGPLFLRSQNVRAGRIDLSDARRVQPPSGSEGTRTRVVPGDVLVTITGNSVGNVASVPSDLGAAYVSQHVGLVRLRDPEMHGWIVAFFSPDGPGNAQILTAQYGQSKPGLNLTNLREFLVPMAPARDRSEIEKRLRAISDMQSRNQNALTRLKTLKTGLMADLLSGRIRVHVDL